ncbi:MAG: CheR family methyltransferase [Allosphingosinicella sp.]|uniref:CheR family methyltransferase n=1 Tax=Allosphingosinicella sp. TaxID=2823234 RepID=UPI0039270F83
MELIDAPSRILAGLLESRTGQQLSLSRRWRIETALGPLMRERGLASLDQLATEVALGRDPRLSERIVEALLNNETYFFRDKAPFDQLFAGALKRIERGRAREKRLSIWCAGCSTGQEAWSLAIAFAEEKLRWQGWTIDIVGTDISRAAIDRAREGLYSQFEIQRGLPVRQMMTWFGEEGGEWRVSVGLRPTVRFEVRSLMEHPPAPGRFDVILCRNVLLYFSGETRRTVFARLAQAIAPDGCLMLGAGETVIGQTDAFASDPDNRGLYLPAAAGEGPALRARSA